MANDLWRTPPEVIEYIERKFGEIKIDLCSSDENKVCEFNLTEDDNFLDDSWLSNSMVDIGDLCWCNLLTANHCRSLSSALNGQMLVMQWQ